MKEVMPVSCQSKLCRNRTHFVSSSPTQRSGQISPGNHLATVGRRIPFRGGRPCVGANLTRLSLGDPPIPPGCEPAKPFRQSLGYPINPVCAPWAATQDPEQAHPATRPQPVPGNCLI